MRLSKTVLLFQAIVTLTIGMIFFAQSLSLDLAKVAEYRIEIPQDVQSGAQPQYLDLRQRYFQAAYILLFVSIVELVMILKLIDS